MHLDIPDDFSVLTVAQLAEFYVRNLQCIKDTKRALWLIERRLSDAVKDTGPMDVDGTRLELLSDGWKWDDEAVVAAMPSLVSKVSVTFHGSKEHMERTIDMVTEEFPGMPMDVTQVVDHNGANRVIRAGGPAAATLQALRSPKTRLGVK